jgi:cytochrome c-type biogenesis protein CcsB
MESLSYLAFWGALGTVALGTLAAWAHLLGVRLVMRRMATEAGEGPLVATLEPSENGWRERLGRGSMAAAWAGAALLLIWVIARWAAVEHAPWSNMYEFTTAFAAAILGFYLAFDRTYGRPQPSRPAGAAVGAVVLPTVLAMLIVAAAFFPSEIRPLVPALQNADLLAIHVAAMILAYAALSVSFAAAVLYLIQAAPDLQRRGIVHSRYDRLPKPRTLDDIALKSVMVGFPLLAAGIALGAYWADHAWGRYWGWDPKETSALVTWLIYGIYLHMRGLRNWSGRRSAWVLVAGFGAVMFTYFAVNLWVSGLHSYAGV